MATGSDIGAITAKLIFDTKEALEGAKKFSAELKQPSIMMEQLQRQATQLSVSWKEFTSLRLGPLVKEGLASGQTEAQAQSQAIKRMNDEWRTLQASTTEGQRLVEAATRSRGDAAVSSGRKAVSAINEELGAVERLKIEILDLKKARESPGVNADQARQMSAEIERAQRQLNELEGGGVKNLRKDFDDTQFAIRRSQQALLALSFAINTFSSDNASEENKKIQKALSESTNIALGTSFAITALGGTLAKFAGPVGIGLGAITLLTHLLDESQIRAETATKAIEKYQKQLKELESKAPALETEDLQEAIKLSREDVNNKRLVLELNKETARFTEEERKSAEAEIKAAQTNVIVLQDELLARERAAKYTSEDLSKADRLIEISKIISDLKKAQLFLSGEELEKNKQMLEMAEKRLAVVASSPEQKRKEELEIVRQEYELGKLTMGQYLRQLQIIRDAASGKAEQLGYEIEIRNILDEQVQLEEQRRQKIKDSTEKQKDALTSLQDSTLQTQTENIPNLLERRQREEEIRHIRRIQEIEEKAQAAGEVGIDAEGSKSFTGEAAEAEAAERIKHDQAVQSIRLSHENELRELRINTIKDDEVRTQARYEFERSLILQEIEQKVVSSEEGELRLQVLRVEHENQMAELELQRYDRALQAIDQIGNLLHRAFRQGGDEFVQKMLIALRIAIQIQQAMKASEAGKGGLDTLDILGIGASIFGLFEKGGYTGIGQKDEPAGVVHKGEIVYEASITEPNKEALLRLRSALQSGLKLDDMNLAVSKKGQLTFVTQEERKQLEGKKEDTVFFNPRDRFAAITYSSARRSAEQDRKELPGYQSGGMVRDFGSHREAFVPFDPMTRYPQMLAQMLVRESAAKETILRERTVETASLNMAPVVEELRDLKAVVRNLEIQQPIIFKNLLDVQQMLREHMPEYESFREKKG